MTVKVGEKTVTIPDRKPSFLVEKEPWKVFRKQFKVGCSPTFQKILLACAGAVLSVSLGLLFQPWVCTQIAEASHDRQNSILAGSLGVAIVFFLLASAVEGSSPRETLRQLRIIEAGFTDLISTDGGEKYRLGPDEKSASPQP